MAWLYPVKATRTLGLNGMDLFCPFSRVKSYFLFLPAFIRQIKEKYFFNTN